MAENQTPDLGAINQSAENQASGGNPPAQTSGEGSANTGTNPVQPTTPPAVNPDPNADAKRGPGRPPKNPTPTLNNGNLGSMKPGELERQQTAPQPSPEETEAAIVRQYGSDYITATNASGMTQYFSRRTWDNLGANKEGYKIVAKVPPEVQELNQGTNAPA